MQEESPKPTDRVALLERNASGRQRSTAIGRLDVHLVAITTGRQMATGGVFDTGGNRTRKRKALDAFRQRASALVWKFQSNGWDEV